MYRQKRVQRQIDEFGRRHDYGPLTPAHHQQQSSLEPKISPDEIGVLTGQGDHLTLQGDLVSPVTVQESLHAD